ncbi:TetR/AcrR family transcriptional regulator [Nocardia veterana]|uniref:TetR/AcrR family transcriptional regulator n=1 Tax=Nocardia veterana TaxID=132249 RepID=A0A7X6RFY8_9NOCA|nr:TetR/AcrR family transcriptional regulator [Nocardia veterana]NKY84562.1 TetR/AcrR family transcriptional regulator [Nocardia veterana]
MGARDRLIDSAVELMRSNGVSGTGIAQLLEHSGISRRSVYLNFPGGKSELIAEATRAAGAAYSALLRTITAGADVASSVGAFPAIWRDKLAASEFTAGCPIVAAALGRAEAPEAADAAGATFTEWETILAERLESEDVAPDLAIALATTVIAALEGAVVLSLATRSMAPLERVGAQMAELIARHTTRAE